MDDELDKKLCAKYPKIFEQRYEKMDRTCMCWGFDCGPGWYGIIDHLCEQLQALDKSFGVQTIATQVKEKFGGLRFYTTERIDEDRVTLKHRRIMLWFDRVVGRLARKVRKGWFWDFRRWVSKRTYTYYIDRGDGSKPVKFGAEVFERVHEAIHRAEEASYKTCEACGNPGKPNNQGWISTLCDQCRRLGRK